MGKSGLDKCSQAMTRPRPARSSRVRSRWRKKSKDLDQLVEQMQLKAKRKRWRKKSFHKAVGYVLGRGAGQVLGRLAIPGIATVTAGVNLSSSVQFTAAAVIGSALAYAAVQWVDYLYWERSYDKKQKKNQAI
jgi:hypothetical protein